MVEQAKQKFGVLRVYLNQSNTDTEALVQSAEAQSKVTCEVCGAGGELRIDRGGWAGLWLTL